MASEKLDRRVRRTRKLLLDSLTQLLETKELKDITVKEISDLADLNRGTFYLHYKDVFDMMDQIQKELFQHFNEIFTTNPPSGNNDTPYNVLCQTFLFLEENKAITKVLMGPHGDYQFIVSMKALVKKHMMEVWEKNQFHIENLEFYYSYCISGILGLIQYWLADDCKIPPLEMASTVTEMITKEIAIFST